MKTMTLDADVQPHNDQSTESTAFATAVAIATLVGFEGNGAPLVRLAGAQQLARPAQTAVRVSDDDLGKQFVVAFCGAGDLTSLVLIGRLQPTAARERAREPLQVEVDGETVTVVARERLVLRCGAASITLTKAGKILINGAYVSSTSTGVNRIRGGSIQLN